jgi:phosphopantothenoylcysteine decarboxylase / phosphopantothenate---cysteine ligase
MARILITSGPTRQYLDPVRYLTNASSGRMGAALASAAVALGHDVIVVTGPVHVAYPPPARVVVVTSTEQMLEACLRELAPCDGVIAAAAPCDYRPQQVATEKIAKTGGSLSLELIETPDIVATLSGRKGPSQWFVGFALETSEAHSRALVKLRKKSCDLMIVNGPLAIDAESNRVEMIDARGQIVAVLEGSKQQVATSIMDFVQTRLIEPRLSR